MQNSVALIAAPYGFGPLSKAIAISSYLPRQLTRVFVGSGVSLDVARQTGEFSHCIDLDFQSPTSYARDLLSDYDVLVFVNTTRFISATSKPSRPTILVETLAWLRRAKPDCAALLSDYFAQSFFSRHFPPELSSMREFHPVGAIIPKKFIQDTRSDTLTNRHERTPLLHCGGLFSTAMIPGAERAFVLQALRVIEALELEFRVILPAQLHREFKQTISTRLTLVECSPLTVGEHLARSPFALSTTGIEFSYECMLLGIPVMFLPPFNASQVFQLRYHQEACPESVLFHSRGEVDEASFDLLHATTANVQREGMSGLWSDQFQEILMSMSRILADSRQDTLQRIWRNQHDRIVGIGRDGAEQIANQILSDLSIEDLDDRSSELRRN